MEGTETRKCFFIKDTLSVINSLIIHKKRKMHVQPEEKSNFRKKKKIISKVKTE